MRFRYLYTILFIYLGFSLTITAQSCLPGFNQFTTQAQIDAFPTNYPGCTNILGSILISGNISNLSGLSQITDIQGFISISHCPILTSLNGLNNLQSVGGQFVLAYSNNLISLSALLNLQNVGSLEIIGTPITNLDGLQNIETINWLRIRENTTLLNLNGFDNLAICNNIELISNTQLSDITGLMNATGSGEFNIQSNPMLTSLNGLQGISSVSSLVIGNNSLVNLIGLENLLSCSWELIVYHNSQLTSISELSNCIVGVGSRLWIENNPLLTSLNGLGGNSLPGEVRIIGNNSLQNLNGLEGITSCNGLGPMQITGNSSLQNLNGLNNLTSADQIIISNNSLLSTLIGLSALQNSYEISISNNPLLSSLSGLENVDMINDFYYLGLQNNANLSYCHLPNVCDFISIYPGSANIIGNNSTCATLSEVEIQCNILLPIELVSFIATSIDNDITLHWQTSSEINNHYFDIEYSIDGTDFYSIGRKEGAGNSNTKLHYHFVDKDVDTGIHYYRLKQVDYDGQYSYSDIKSVLVKEESSDVSIYPNPASAEVTINATQPTELQVLDVYGRLLKSQNISEGSNTINLAGMSTGMLFFIVGNQRFKVVKE